LEIKSSKSKKVKFSTFSQFYLPSSNLPAPINAGPDPQTKAGNLIIGGLLKIGQYSSAPTGSTGALYYDTTANEFKGYKSTGWASLGGTSPVSSVFGRTGAVTAASGDYSVGNITGAAPLASPTFTGSVTMPGTGIWNSSGNVGIGTTGPTVKLDVKGTATVPPTSGTTSGGIFRIDEGNNAVLDFGGNPNSPYGAWIQSTNKTTLAVNYPLVLNPNGGNVGIWKTNPGTALDVAGTVTATQFVGGGAGITGVPKGTLSCLTKTCSFPYQGPGIYGSCTVTCDTGYVSTGCESSFSTTMTYFIDSPANSCKCDNYDSHAGSNLAIGVTCYARCCTLQ